MQHKKRPRVLLPVLSRAFLPQFWGVSPCARTCFSTFDQTQVGSSRRRSYLLPPLHSYSSLSIDIFYIYIIIFYILHTFKYTSKKYGKKITMFNALALDRILHSILPLSLYIIYYTYYISSYIFTFTCKFLVIYACIWTIPKL